MFFKHCGFLLTFCVIIIGARLPFATYSEDGVGNNLNNREWGSVGQLLVYNFDPVPFDDLGDLELPNERIISNELFSARHGQQRVTPRNVTDFLTAWAQFVDHDIVKTPSSSVTWPIPVPRCDRMIDPECTGTKEIPFSRALTTDKDDEFSHPNLATAWLDASQIYGTSLMRQQALREFRGGLLRASEEVDSWLEHEWPPRCREIPFSYRKYMDMDNDVGILSTSKLFAAGDARANEQPLLLALQVLFFREHNRIARILGDNFPFWNDERIFQSARAYVIAEVQRITFKEYLFHLLGGRQFDVPYTGHKPDVSPNIKVAFSSGAFRYGHSEVNSLMKKMIKGDYGELPQSLYTQLRENFFDNRAVLHDGITPMFEGMYEHQQGSMDNQAAEDIRSCLFKGNGPCTRDLMAMDVRRGRDMGIPSFNEIRKAYGLPPVSNWSTFRTLAPSNEIPQGELVRLLSDLYDSPDSCDLFSCGLCEDWVVTAETAAHGDYSNLGPTFEAIIIDQFAAIRDGDRFWYESEDRLNLLRSFNCLPEITERTLADIIRDNAPENYDVLIGDDVFFNRGLLGLIRRRPLPDVGQCSCLPITPLGP